MEQAETFEGWLANVIKDGKACLGMTDETLAYIILRAGLACYLRTIANKTLNTEG